MVTPPLPGSALQCAPVNYSHAAANAEELDRVFRFQFAQQWRHFVDRICERFRFGNLRADVHLHADNFDIAHSRRAFINRRDVIERDAKLVLVRTGRDVFVGVRFDVGIHTQRNGSTQVFCAGDVIDLFQFLLAFDVEAVNAFLQRVFDFLARFADSSECAFGRITARREHTKQFAARDDIKPCARFREQFEYRAI